MVYFLIIINYRNEKSSYSIKNQIVAFEDIQQYQIKITRSIWKA